MKQFDLSEYLKLVSEGKEPKIVTRAGRHARVICTDRLTNVIKGVVSRRVIALVEFDGCESPIMYTQGGKFVGNKDNEYDLFFVEDKEETLYEFKPFEQVLVRYDELSDWQPEFFYKYDETCDDGKYFTIGNVAWPFCIPYEGNEALIGTKKRP